MAPSWRDLSCSAPTLGHQSTRLFASILRLALYALPVRFAPICSASACPHAQYPHRLAVYSFFFLRFENAVILTDMHWLSQGQNGSTSLDELQLDIVGFLAILGEGSVLANAQVSTLSKWIFLPRLIPAPQALMRPTRPNRLEPFPGYVTGIVSGNHRDSINHIGNIVW